MADTVSAAQAEVELLRVEHVSKVYRQDTREFTAIQDINLHIKSGEFVCLLGPSGCGKSTLLRIITGLNTYTCGEVFYRGNLLTGVNPHATIVFQTFALYPWLTVNQNLDVALKARGLPPAERSQRTQELLNKVGMAGFESAYPRELSGGMRQKVGFARAMAVGPELLCLDEPFSALDVLSAEAIRGELMELWLNKTMAIKAVLMVTHNIEEAVLMADRIYVMGKNPGHVLADISNQLPHPRMRKDTAFQALVERVYTLVAGHKSVDSDQQPRQLRRLPMMHLNALTGLVEKLEAEGGQIDLHVLAAELHLELREIVQIVESGELIGLVIRHDGNLQVTPLGRNYSQASIPLRSELISGRVLRIPIINFVFETLQNDDNCRVHKSFFIERFQSEFGADADEQFEIVLRWGRAADLFDFDRQHNEVFLPDDQAPK